VNRLLRLLHHLFGDEPPPRPHGHGEHHRRHGHHQGDDEGRREAEDQVFEAADDGPAPSPPHGH
jgi:hypothetical protein